MKKAMRALLTVTITLGATHGFAANTANSDPASTDPKTCILMPDGKFKGLCLDLSEDRTLILMNDDEKTVLANKIQHPELLNENNIFVQNYSNQGKFWTAIIPINRIQDMIYQEIDILPKIGFSKFKIKNLIGVYHSQIRFEMNPEGNPIYLIDESQPQKLIEVKKGPTSDDMVFALWAVRAQGHQEVFNPLNGQTDQYDATYALQGYDAATNWIIEGPDKDGKTPFPTKQFLIKATPEQSRETFLYALKFGNARGTSIMYNTAVNSCSNAVFDVLLPTFHQEVSADSTERAMQSIDPLGQMKRFKMIDFSRKIPSISQEFKNVK